MAQKITLFAKPAPNSDFVTKNGTLNSQEFDTNLIYLYDLGIKEIKARDKDLILVKNDDTELVGENVLKTDEAIKSITFDTLTCNLILTYTNGETDTVKNFRDFLLSTQVISTDSTIDGDGSPIYPLSISDNYRTGQFMPVDGIVSCAEGDCDCNQNDCKCLSKLPAAPSVGERFVTKEKINLYGKLYNFHGVKHIARALCENYHYHQDDACKGWHIPSIDDWNDLLNSVEPNMCDKNHAENASFCGDKGMFAGTLLKSSLREDLGGWRAYDPTTDNGCNCCDDHHSVAHTCDHTNHHNFIDNGNCNCNSNPCSCNTTGCCGTCGSNKPCLCFPSMSQDLYKFSILPAGYGVHSEQLSGDGVLAYFWTCNYNNGQVAVKRFCYDSGKVHSDMIGECSFCSLRLVKDYDGHNFHEFETILGKTYRCVLMPSAKGKRIWLASNFDGGVECCTKDCIHKSSLTPSILDRVNSPAKFYINEWKGFGWVKNELNEGDTFVVKSSPVRELRVEKDIITSSNGVNVNYKLVNPFNDTIKDATTSVIGQISDNKTIQLNGLNKIEVMVANDASHTNNLLEVTDNNGLFVDGQPFEDLKAKVEELEGQLSELVNTVLSVISGLNNREGGASISIKG